jgi:hypothetical protein
MHATEHQRRSEAAGARRRDLDERHLGDGERLQAAPQPLELRLLDPLPSAAPAVLAILREMLWDPWNGNDLGGAAPPRIERAAVLLPNQFSASFGSPTIIMAAGKRAARVSA